MAKKGNGSITIMHCDANTVIGTFRGKVFVTVGADTTQSKTQTFTIKEAAELRDALNLALRKLRRAGKVSSKP